MNREVLETIITETDIVSVLTTRYCIKDPRVEKLPGGTESLAWRVADGDHSWVTKVFLSEGKRTWLKEECGLYRYLNAHGFHVPVIRTSGKGRSIESIHRDGETFDVIVMRGESLRRAEPSSVTQEEINVIAHSIASMHRVLSHYPNKRTYQERARVEKPRGDYPESAFQALTQSVHARRFNERQLQTFEDTDAAMLTAIHTRVPRGPLTHSIIHGDLALEHAQFLHDGSVYLFDFGDRMWAPVARELGIFLTMLYQWEDISFSRWERLKQWVIGGYESVSPLTPHDRSAILYFELKRLMEAMSYLATLEKDTESEHVATWIRRGYELGEYLLASV